MPELLQQMWRIDLRADIELSRTKIEGMQVILACIYYRVTATAKIA